MEKETNTNVKIDKAELIQVIAAYIGVSPKQITYFDNFEVPDNDGFDGYSFGGIKLTYKHNQ